MTEDNKNKGVTEGERPEFKADAPKTGRSLKVRRIGNSLGVVLPKEVLAKLRVGEGDSLSVHDTPGGVVLSHYDESMVEQVDVMRSLMKRYRNALRELAK